MEIAIGIVIGLTIFLLHVLTGFSICYIHLVESDEPDDEPKPPKGGCQCLP